MADHSPDRKVVVICLAEAETAHAGATGPNDPGMLALQRSDVPPTLAAVIA
jgi:hypothetical protein